MSNLLRKYEKTSITERENRYKVYNFCQNPFPKNPSVTIGGSDNRENGSIYKPDLRIDEEKKFEQLLIPRPDKPETHPIAFLMDYATTQGRGIGKTVFLNHQRLRIMDDFGEKLSKETHVLFAAYILPVPGENYKLFWKISKLIFESLVEQNIISLALCRIRAFSGNISESVLSEVGDDLIQTLGNESWLNEKGVNTFTLNHNIHNKFKSLSIESNLANNLAHNCYNTTQFKQSMIDNISDSIWRKYGNKYLFDDLIKVLKLAGFSKGVILFDELEKVFPPMNRLERRIFVESIRHYFIDGNNENAKTNFYELLLTIHPYLQELMGPHWKAAGLQRFASLVGDLSDNYTIYFKPINDESAIPLAIEYLNASRLDEKQELKDSMKPFDKEALVHALKFSSNIPGRFLTFLHIVLEKAIDMKWRKITKKRIDEVIRTEIPTEPKYDKEEETLEPRKVDLKE